MNAAKTSRTLYGLLILIAITFVALVYTFYSIKLSSKDLLVSSEKRYHSYLLADELRQSSDDLTRLARTYAVTADPEYEREYLQVLQIRNGKAPRPEGYHRIYWDFVAAGNLKPRPDGETVALNELMRRAGFNDAEFARLKEAQDKSDGLVQLETKAMNAVKGKFIDPQGTYSINAAPDLALARDLLHGREYHQFKGQIMKPVDEFFGLVEERTDQQVTVADNTLSLFQNLFIAVLLALILEIALLVMLGRKQMLAQLGGTPAVLDKILSEIANGNLGVLIPDAPANSAMSSVRVMSTKLRELIGQALVTSAQLNVAVGQVTQVVEGTAERAVQQNEMTDMVATAVHEMGLTVQEIARNASSAAEASNSARSEAQQASQMVGSSTVHIEQMADGIGHAAKSVSALAEQIATIDQVLAVIRGISQQTNLLALNAAIEAARAGEMGRGFAVVADEVRTLAGRTQGSTDEIQGIIQNLKQGAEAAVSSMSSGQAATGTGVEASESTNRLLQTISSQIEHISDMNRQVATATEEQSSVTEEINRNVQGIADLATTTNSEVQRCREDCRTLRGLSENLTKQMGSFRL
ncbi:methyl-accepting chemotaxis protein [Pseudomonas sp. ArH3a]|uniref:Methyl-accepting chemotaxis protein PctB n=2 Tax=Pseudomonas TaxID=286 RepID=A0A1H0B074_9PSED|nr:MULTISPECIES: methyl-accepting chemotaxis protein [Pseudomonas]KAF2405717.1 methyl-accepting chemotaxis protein PctB [Pseudomonas antarctica]OZO01172.1 methyl-accepting chemotaxis protein [Pseudomonas sp. IB20]UNM17444.1 methyl-accepting chemotaxis protein [Pseudomonas sp. ArH3a]SDN38966.1 methyl-accepting chemotaxis sensory transducer with Cache sensor [Pseudomonas antarctica]